MQSYGRFFIYLILSVLILNSSPPNRACATKQLPPRGPSLSRPAASILPTSSPPSVDGVSDDSCWDSAVVLKPFNLSYQARFSPYKAEALLAYDAENLYACIRVSDPNEEDHPWLPWPPDRDASVAELLIATGSEEAFYKVAVNSKEKVYVTQPMANAVPWNEPVTAVMKRSEGLWTAEFAVPFAAVNLPSPAPTAAWRVNLGWRTPKCVAYSAWAVTHAWFYEAQYYGDLFFAGPHGLTAQIQKVDELHADLNRLPLHLRNGGSAEAKCEILAVLENPKETRVAYQRIVTLPAGGDVEVPVEYTLPDGTVGVVTVSVFRGGDSEPFFRQSIPVEFPENRKTCREIEAALASVPEDVPGLEAERESILADLASVRGEVDRLSRDPGEWRNLAPTLDRLLGRAKKLLWRFDHRERLADAPFAVGQEHSLQKVIRDRAYEGEPADVISLSAARGEYEGAQLFLIPLKGDLAGVEAIASSLEGPDGAVIPKEAIEVRWTDFVETRTPRYPVEYSGWYADPLLPWDAAPKTVAAEALHQPLWLTVAVPHDIPAGVYTGQVKIAADGFSWPVRIRLRVYDFDLPTRPFLQTSMWLNESHIKNWYGWEEIPKDLHRRQMEFLLEHRINPTWFGPIGTDEDIEFQLERGLNLVMLGVADEWPLEKETEEKIDRYYNFFKERDLLDLVFIYGQDEPSPHHYPKVRDTLAKVAEEYPGVRRACTAYPPVPTLEGYVDTWVVGPNLFNYGPVADRVAAGDELWFYLSASVRRPYVTQFYLDYTALENRLISWYCWKYGATGFLYWGIDEWRSNNQPWSGKPEIDDAIRAGKRWPEIPWNTWTYLNCNGDAQYIYPGTDGEFWSSVRMEIIRDSFEDYDYMALLDGARKRLAEAGLPQTESLLAEAGELLTIGPPIASDLTEATDNPVVLLKRRAAIAEHLERVLARLDEK